MLIHFIIVFVFNVIWFVGDKITGRNYFDRYRQKNGNYLVSIFWLYSLSGIGCLILLIIKL